jgi:hypothetical protein
VCCFGTVCGVAQRGSLSAMTPRGELFRNISDQLADHDLTLHGGFTFNEGEPTPEGPNNNPAKSILLIGNAGGAFWARFCRWQAEHPEKLDNPLDTWCREIIGCVAARFGARAVSPSDTPFLPFQQWAMRAEGLSTSPLGILMHPDYGLWHAYRGALLFDHEIPIQPARAVNHLCDLCDGKPCLKACPVEAHSAAGFAYRDCLAHVRGENGQPCRDHGCFDRNACPYGTEFRYPPDMQAFIMHAFARL